MVDQFKVVIIDDNQLIVESLESTISWKELGLNVAGHAYDGMEGKDLIQRVQPDIIITDISMPGMDGLTMVKDSSDFLQKSKVIVTVQNPLLTAGRSQRSQQKQLSKLHKR